jgi:hypothetical protein
VMTRSLIVMMLGATELVLGHEGGGGGSGREDGRQWRR